MSIIRALRDLWCGYTNRCRVEIDHDDTIRNLMAQERAADRSAADIRARRMNVLEAELIRARIDELKRRDRHHE